MPKRNQEIDVGSEKGEDGVKNEQEILELKQDVAQEQKRQLETGEAEILEAGNPQKIEQLTREVEEALKKEEIPVVDRIMEGQTRTIGEIIDHIDQETFDTMADRGSREERAKKYLRYKEINKELQVLSGKRDKITKEEKGGSANERLSEITKDSQALLAEKRKLKDEIFDPYHRRAKGLWDTIKKTFTGKGLF